MGSGGVPRGVVSAPGSPVNVPVTSQTAVRLEGQGTILNLLEAFSGLGF